MGRSSWSGVGFAAALAAPAALDVSACPTEPGAFIAVQGAEYEVYCNWAFLGDNVGGITIQKDYAACVARCSIFPECVGAVWNSILKHCEIKTSLEGHSIRQDIHSFKRTLAETAKRHDHYSPIIEPIERRAELSCPIDDQGRTEQDGTSYDVECQTSYEGNIIKNSNESDFMKCLRVCNGEKKCMAANYHGNWCMYSLQLSSDFEGRC